MTVSRPPRAISKRAAFPRACTERLLVEHLDGETLVYDRRRHRAHCLNRTAARLWRLCNGRRSTSDLTERLSELAGPGLDEQHVSVALRGLRAAKLVEMPRETRAERGAGRRSALTRIGRLAGSLAMLPTIVSIVVPTAAEAASCLARNANCTASAQCCSGCCRPDPGVLHCKPGGGGCI